MNKLFLIIALLLTGCSGATRVVSTTPKGKIPHNDNQLEGVTNGLSHNGIWITLWLISICIALFFVFKTFKKEN